MISSIQTNWELYPHSTEQTTPKFNDQRAVLFHITSLLRKGLAQQLSHNNVITQPESLFIIKK